ENYEVSKKGWLEQFWELPNGIPSHNTFGRVFSRLKSEELEKHFQDWVRRMRTQSGLDLVFINGKNVAVSYDRKKANSPARVAGLPLFTNCSGCNLNFIFF
ncbi:transposase family protein, partial [Synechocystis salina LEGE 06155]|nr:transposase family protein [Synechocystis salina LEGE 06155]